MKVTVKMHAASLVWCGITEFLFAPFSSPCSNFGFGSFSEMILLISVAAGRIQDPVLPRWVSRYWPEWDCALPCLVYGAKHRDLTLRISFFFFSFSFFFILTAYRREDGGNREIHVCTEAEDKRRKRRGSAVIFGMLWRLPGSER